MTIAMVRQDIRGFGGGGKAGDGGHTPTEAPDSLHSISYARVLDLISEGEIKGLVNGLESVFLDGTPLKNEDGTFNFSGVSVDFRAGTQDQEHISGVPGVENELGVGVELTSETPYTRSVTNVELSALRVRLSVPALSRADTSNGDIHGYRVDYALDIATDGGAYVEVVAGAFDGKTVNEYQRSIRVDLPAATTGWLLRVRRTTPSANSAAIADTTRVVSVTEIIDAKLRYPMSALVGLKVDAKQFRSVPTRSYLMDLRIIKVPTNYNPETRAYTGTWDGTFKLAWSNNPAWVYYDMVTNERFGLGHLVSAAQVDRYSLYEIAQYCDVMVPDGKGGTEPRFTCNVYLQAQADALKLLSDLVSVFRGISYWAGGKVVTSCDMPSDPVYTYAPANVLGGLFTYSGSRRKTRATVALVSWNDPEDQYRAKVAYCDDRDGIARYGVRQISLIAFGCTSEAQAQRVGQWALLTSRLETESVSFGVGLDGVIPAPGDVIAVANPNRAGKRMGGRIRTVAGRTVGLDRVPEELAAGDKLSVVLPSGRLQAQTITLVSDSVVTVADDWDEVPRVQSMWLAETPLLKAQLFRVLSITERARGQNEDGTNTGMSFDVTAVMHEPGKFDLVDSGVRIEPRPVSVIPPSVQPPPTNVTLASRVVFDQGTTANIMTIAWDAAPHAVEYSVEWRKDSGEWVPMARTGSLSVEVPGIYAGLYLARVRSINVLGVASLPAVSESTQLDGKDTPPPAPASLSTAGQLFGISLAWGFPASGVSDTQRTEIWYSELNDRSTAVKLGDYAYPQHNHTMLGLGAAVRFYFWARLVDRIGNIGAWYPASETAGVSGQSNSDASEILDYLTGQIGATQLASELLESIGESSVAVEAISTSLASMYTIKTALTVGGRLYMAGIGVGVENDDGVVESQVLVAADKFAILNTGDETLTSPFVVVGGNTYINRAFIGNAYINTAMIEDLAVDSLKIKNDAVIVPFSVSRSSSVFGTCVYGGDQTLVRPICQVTTELDSTFDTNPKAGVSVFLKTTLAFIQAQAPTVRVSINLYRKVDEDARVLIAQNVFSGTQKPSAVTTIYNPMNMVFDQPGSGVVTYYLEMETVCTGAQDEFYTNRGGGVAGASGILGIGSKK